MREIEVVLNFHRTKDGLLARYSRAKTISPEGRDMLIALGGSKYNKYVTKNWSQHRDNNEYYIKLNNLRRDPILIEVIKRLGSRIDTMTDRWSIQKVMLDEDETVVIQAMEDVEFAKPKKVKTVKITESETDHKNTENISSFIPFRMLNDVLYVSANYRSLYAKSENNIWKSIKEKFPKIAQYYTDTDGDYFLETISENGETRTCNRIALPMPSPLDEWYIYLYKTYLKPYDPRNWYHLIPNAILLTLSDKQCDDLLEDNYEETINRLDVVIKGDTDYFAKSGSSSTKHNYPPAPVRTGIEVVKHLMASDNVRKSLKSRRGNSILLSPWTTAISAETEFRVFTKCYQVVGVSQQHLYKVVPLMKHLSGVEVVEAFQKLWNDCLDELTYPEDYRECTFDGYITTDESGLVAHMIELNAGNYGWGPAGSALFEWNEDRLPEVNNAIEFRYTIKNASRQL